MLRIISLFLQFPEVGFHGFYTIRLILLSCESGLVSGDLHEVFRTSGYCCCHRREAVTLSRLVGGYRSGALHFLAQEQAVTIRVGGSCRSVRAKQHLVAAVLRVLTRLTQCAGHMINTGTPFYFCHSRSAIGSHWSIPLR